jgi:hypothetical protein
MLQYPSIVGSAKAPIGKSCIAFEKYDGSNLRWEWTPKQGWNKFGTRKHLFDASDLQFGEAIPIFMEKLADDIVYRTKQIVRNPERITAFTEFLGENSFAGSHVASDPKELKLFDVFLFKKGFVQPKQFVETYGSAEYAARVVYEGNLNRQFIMDVRDSKYPGFEGVIAKGNDFMVKIKTKAFFAKLQEKYDGAWEQYGE